VGRVSCNVNIVIIFDKGNQGLRRQGREASNCPRPLGALNAFAVHSL
jgi:hypothetical protein